MKYLKMYEALNLFSFEQDNDLKVIKEILLELRHEYDNLEGEITVEKFDTGEYLVIRIKPLLPIISEDVRRLYNHRKKLIFYNIIIECCERIIEATNRDVVIKNLYNTDKKDIEIWINDVKTRGHIRKDIKI